MVMREKKCSGYLQIYNDWELLEASLNSFKGIVDELIVVDGCYEWMASYYTSIGYTAEKSQKKIYDILDASGIPYKSIPRVWKNQIEKRIAGYNACTYGNVIRLDSDELILFDKSCLNDFYNSEYAVGMMNMPTFINSEYMVGLSDGSLPEQCFIFDKSRISAEVHLNYLWLILPADELPSKEQRPFEVYPHPLAFNVHMTSWRSLQTSVNRASYYNLNWCRQHGFEGIHSLKDKPMKNVNSLFKLVPPISLRRALYTNIVAMGKVALEAGEVVLSTSALDEPTSHKIRKIYSEYISTFAGFNAERLPQPFFNRMEICYDISTPEALSALTKNQILSVKSSSNIVSATCNVMSLHSSPPYMRLGALATEFSGLDFLVKVEINESSDLLRAVLLIALSTDEKDSVNYFSFV